MKKKLLLLSAAAAVVTAGVISLTTEKAQADGNGEKEKCFGIAKAGKNDCGSNAHSCAGHAAADGDANEWVFVPKGLCEKLVGGSTQAGE